MSARKTGAVLTVMEFSDPTALARARVCVCVVCMCVQRRVCVSARLEALLCWVVAVSAEEEEPPKNRSCIKLMTQYKFTRGDSADIKDTVTCGNCTR